jgi:hypothetical protein
MAGRNLVGVHPSDAWVTDDTTGALLGIQRGTGNPMLPVLPGLPASGFIVETSKDNITAFPGGGQTNATLLTVQTNRITTVTTSGDSVRLPASAPGVEVTVINHGANPMQVYGLVTDTVNDVATATGVSQMQNSSVLYFSTTAGAWYTEGLASGFVNGLPTTSAVNGITAFAGGGQASGTLIGATINRVTTVATIGDSLKLPLAAPGLSITVSNATSNSLNLFPGVGDAINGAAANAAYAIAGTKTAVFTSAVAGFWHAVLSA